MDAQEKNLRESFAAALAVIVDQQNSIVAENAKLREQLADQQATIRVLIRAFGMARRNRSDDWDELQNIDERFSYFETKHPAVELNTLLAKAREEGRKEAVPDGWQVVPKEPTKEMVKASWNCEGVTSPTHRGQRERIAIAYQAMLASAPKPEEKL